MCVVADARGLPNSKHARREAGDVFGECICAEGAARTKATVRKDVTDEILQPRGCRRLACACASAGSEFTAVIRTIETF